MKCHLSWIRFVAAAAIVTGGQQAGAQYAPYRPLPQQGAPIAAGVSVAPTAVMQQQVVPQQRTAVAQQQQAIAPQQQAVAPALPAGQPTYMAYRPQVPQQTVAPQQTAAPQAVVPQQTAMTQQQVATPYRAPAVTTYPQVATAYPQVAHMYPPASAAYPQTADRYSPYYSTVAQENAPLPPPEENGTIPPPGPNGIENNGPTNNGHANGHANGHDMSNGATNGATNGMVNGHGTNGVHNGAPMPPSHGYNGYPTTSHSAAGCEEGGYGDYGLSGYFDNPCHDAQWFGGVYFLWMERDNASPVKLTVEIDHAAVTEPYYPPADVTVMTSHRTDFDFREGVELRFGSTFTVSDACASDCGSGCGTGYGYGYNGGAGCGTQACNMSCPDVYAWEVAMWGLNDDDQWFTYVDDGASRIYGMINFVGLEYDRDGAGAAYAYRPVNDYYGYGLPIQDPPGAPADGYITVIAQRVRQNFEAQNLELNLIRFPVCEASCGGCATGCDAGGCGDTGYSGCATGCETECCPSALSVYGSCGLRYFRAEEAFMYASEGLVWTAGAPEQGGTYNGFGNGANELYYTIDVENHLAGGQLGWTMNYCVACKWNFFANSTFGVFNNHVNHYQRVYGDGITRYAGTGETFRVRSDKDDIAFLGELRLGGSYDITCNWRAVAAYRAVAMTGIANSTDQIPSDFTNANYVSLINSDNSMIVHGLQVGAECRY